MGELRGIGVNWRALWLGIALCITVSGSGWGSAVLHDNAFPEGVADVAQLSREANEGDARAMYLLGMAYALGEGVRQDYGTAVDWLTRAARSHYAPALAELGYFREKGLGVRLDYSRARRYYREAAEQGYAVGMRRLGFMHLYGFGTRADSFAALEWLRMAAAQDDRPALEAMGHIYWTGKANTQFEDQRRGNRKFYPPDYAAAVRHYRRAQELGSPAGTYHLALAYRDGHAVQADLDRAVALFEEAAKMGMPAAQAALGELYEAGRGVPQDSVRALQYYQAAAQYPAFANTLQERIVGLEIALGNRSSRLNELEKKARAGDFEAALLLVRIYEEGLYGIAPNARLAREWNTVADRILEDQFDLSLSVDDALRGR